jgi:hypothetical protein
LHDTTIQPYIGLKLALDGLYREAGEEEPLSPRIADLIEMADSRFVICVITRPISRITRLPGEFWWMPSPSRSRG